MIDVKRWCVGSSWSPSPRRGDASGAGRAGPHARHTKPYEPSVSQPGKDVAGCHAAAPRRQHACVGEITPQDYLIDPVALASP
jgi:hypothetical protein